MDHHSSSIADAKAAIRREALARRDGLPADMRAAAAQAIAERPFPLAVAADAIVSGFMPLKSEINPIPLMRRLAGAGAQLALPAVAGRGSRSPCAPSLSASRWCRESGASANRGPMRARFSPIS